MAALVLSLPFLPGCATPFAPIDRALLREARLALGQERPPPFDEDEDWMDEEPEEAPRYGKSVILGELLAIFPGILWHGLGHYYAGDTQTARSLQEAGGWGYLLTALGGGLLVGGYYLDKEDDIWNGYSISLYVAGGATVTIGSAFFLTAWFYDMIDTPRAVRSGGRPPAPGTLFNKSGEDLGDNR